MINLDSTGKAQCVADADFIAHAREDIPALMAEVKRLRAESSSEFEQPIDDGFIARAALSK